jgi:hypothetical protein
MAYAYFDSKYAPCYFLIVPDDGDPHGEDAVLVQSDWDFPGVARNMGWTPCECNATDGTVPCHVCNRQVGDMIAEAYDFIRAREGERFETLDEYLKGD